MRSSRSATRRAAPARNAPRIASSPDRTATVLSTSSRANVPRTRISAVVSCRASRASDSTVQASDARDRPGESDHEQEEEDQQQQRGRDAGPAGRRRGRTAGRPGRPRRPRHPPPPRGRPASRAGRRPRAPGGSAPGSSPTARRRRARTSGPGRPTAARGPRRPRGRRRSRSRPAAGTSTARESRWTSISRPASSSRKPSPRTDSTWTGASTRGPAEDLRPDHDPEQDLGRRLGQAEAHGPEDQRDDEGQHRDDGRRGEGQHGGACSSGPPSALSAASSRWPRRWSRTRPRRRGSRRSGCPGRWSSSAGRP